MCFGVDCLPESSHADFFDPPGRPQFEAAFTNWDGKWYAAIARDGYTYNPDAMSSVAFFPAYPLLGRALARATGLPHAAALTALSNLFLLATLALLIDYVRRRFPGGPPDLPEYTALAVALSPLGVFFRAAYTESLFILLTTLTLYGLLRRWPVAVLALVVGLATATRATGLALVLPLLIGVWGRSSSWRARLLTLAWVVPLSGWGLAAYVAYQAYAFGDPAAFSQTQKHWTFRSLATPGESGWAVLTLKPFWEVYDPASDAYWGRHDKHLSPPFSLQFANPLYLTAAAALTAVGVWRRWLSPAEAVLAVGLLGIPYLTRGYNGCMTSQARYAAAAVPVYLVLGQILARLPPPVASAVLAVCGFLMGVYSALFAARFLVI